MKPPESYTSRLNFWRRPQTPRVGFSEHCAAMVIRKAEQIKTAYFRILHMDKKKKKNTYIWHGLSIYSGYMQKGIRKALMYMYIQKELEATT